MSEQQRAIEIVATPAGEAPLWVREAWIGLVLPLAAGRASGSWSVVGVLSGPRTCTGALWAWLSGRTGRVTGYRVPSADAVRILAARNRAAADWWRAHTDYAESERACFIFDAPACRPVA